MTILDNETMNINEEQFESKSDQKKKIRERYKGISEDELDIIPAIPQDSFYDESKKKRVAVYARVSTDDPRQTSSYELQKNHYTDMVNHHSDWDLVDIYADEGISGTSLQHRDAFIRMIEDCKAGKIDLIVTKSVSRFARNVLDCIGYVRQLKAMNPPIGILFETENIFTLNANSEMSLSFIATLAQEESHNKSEIMNASIEMRFKRGIFLTPALLGYDQDDEGNLVINENEARIVRLIFFLYLYGYSSQQIADILTKLRCRTKKGNYSWNASSIVQILQNERHCGDVLARKTFTPNYLDHKSKKNNRDRNQYIQRDHHESIVSRDDFIAVQQKILNSRYGTQKFLPSLNTIKDGLLKGFVLINTKWAGFSAKDYIEASKSVNREETTKDEPTSERLPDDGDFDFRGFEVTRVQFINTAQSISIRISENFIFFNMEAINQFPKCQYVQLYIDPIEKLLAIKPCKKNEKYCVQWSRTIEGKLIGRQIFSSAFLPKLFEIMSWNKECKYKCIGNYKSSNKQEILIFNLSDYEVLMPKPSNNDSLNEVRPLITSGSKNIVAYPPEWSDSFGPAVYEHPYTNESKLLSEEDKEINEETVVYKNEELNITEPEEVHKEIKQLISYLGGEYDDQGIRE